MLSGPGNALRRSLGERTGNGLASAIPIFPAHARGFILFEPLAPFHLCPLVLGHGQSFGIGAVIGLLPVPGGCFGRSQ